MDIGNISSLYTKNITGESTSSSKIKDKLSTGDFSNASDEELMDACKQFESYLVEMVFKEMEKTAYVFSDEKKDPNSTLVDFFKGNTLQELASTSTERNGLGLAQTLFEQMKRNNSL